MGEVRMKSKDKRRQINDKVVDIIPNINNYVNRK